jgi:Glutamine cyclotransferase
VALSRKYRWIEVNRDHNPEIPKNFTVFAYPSFIVVGDKREKIYRFQSFMKPDEFISHLREGLKRWELYRKGEEWDPLPPRAESISEEATAETFKAPTEERVSGLTVLNGKLWVAQGKELHRMSLATGKTEKTYTNVPRASGLCTDGRMLYAVDYGWTAGRPIYVVDPASARVVREIVTEEMTKNRAFSANGIAWMGGNLWINAYRDRLFGVDPASGKIVARKQLPKGTWKLAFDGTHLLTVAHPSDGNNALLLVNPETCKVVRRVALNYSLGGVCFHDGKYLVTEQPVMGFDKANKRVRLWPKQTLIYQLELKPQHRVR